MAEGVVIIGAGAAGLMAAYELATANVQVTVLEGRSRLGGRIHTIYDPLSGNPLELGAEFVHGDLPVTKELARKAKLDLIEVGGEMWQVKDDELVKEEQLIEHWDEFKQVIKDLKHDRTINELLEEHFSSEHYASLRQSVRQYASGYDTADPEKASALALAAEWLSVDETQYRIAGGYQQLINFLAEEVITLGGQIHTGKTVKQIVWLSGTATAVTDSDETFAASKVIVTVPVSVLTAHEHDTAALSFSPALPGVAAALRTLQVGAVIKVILLFNEPFWRTTNIAEPADGDKEELGFAFSKEAIPTWWTQHPGTLPQLTGWLGGPPARDMELAADEDILEAAITSLANIFRRPADELRKELRSWKVINWTADPYTRGSYSYATLDTAIARKVLEAPVEGTIYFAGEHMFDGKEMGTVEAALISGRGVAHSML